jgi:hypothetical protein
MCGMSVTKRRYAAHTYMTHLTASNSQPQAGNDLGNREKAIYNVRMSKVNYVGDC